MRLWHKSKGPIGRRLAGLRRWPFWLAFALLASGCAGKQVVVSDCPAPNIAEQDDLEEFLFEDEHPEAQAWVSRVLGHIYDVELREVRDEPTD